MSEPPSGRIVHPNRDVVRSGRLLILGLGPLTDFGLEDLRRAIGYATRSALAHDFAIVATPVIGVSEHVGLSMDSAYQVLLSAFFRAVAAFSLENEECPITELRIFDRSEEKVRLMTRTTEFVLTELRLDFTKHNEDYFEVDIGIWEEGSPSSHEPPIIVEEEIQIPETRREAVGFRITPTVTAAPATQRVAQHYQSPSTMSSKLVGIYYPYSRCINEIALKKALLIFDELCFVDPVERLVREYLVEQEFPEVSRIVEVYAELEELGVARSIFPFPQIRECDKLLWEAAATDEEDAEFREFFSQEQNLDAWGILKNKYSGGSSIYVTADIRVARGYGTMGGMSVEEAKTEGFYGTDEDFSSRYIMKTAHELLPPALGLSLGINHTLVICESGDYLPFTDSGIAHSALMLKYRRAASNPSAPFDPPRTQELDQKFLSLSFSLLGSVLSDDVIAGRSVHDVVRFREETQEELVRFRRRLRILAAEIEEHPWNIEFRESVLKKIETEIAREMQTLSDSITNTYEQMFGNLIKKSAGLTTPTLVGTVLAGLSPGQILAFSTAAITGALGMTIPEFVDVWLAKRKLRRNGLSFLLKARKQFS